jgi:hypothetical protein
MPKLRLPNTPIGLALFALGVLLVQCCAFALLSRPLTTVLEKVGPTHTGTSTPTQTLVPTETPTLLPRPTQTLVPTETPAPPPTLKPTNTAAPIETSAPLPTPLPTRPSPVPVAVSTPTLQYQLATINKGYAVDQDDPTILRFRSVLESLDRKTPQSKQEISDMLVAGHELLRDKYGKNISLLELAEGADSSIPSGVEVNFAEVLAVLVTLMVGGG